ncbi:MAG: ABC transporter permease [Ruminococcaceae bacterium]|nr:ABC transporter permease [Oscillospiraceae bacterium]
MIKIVKQNEVSKKQSILIMLGAIAIAFVISGIVIAAFGKNPFQVFAGMVQGALLKPYGIKQTLNKAIPLVVLSLGVSIAFKMKFWNIGAEGQFYFGAIGATFCVTYFPNLPAYILLPLMMVVAMLFAGIYALIPALLKVRFGASETLVTLMLNYIAVIFVDVLQSGVWKSADYMGRNHVAKYPENALLPKLFGVHIGWIFALILAVIVYILLKKTKLGYEISVLGENERTARYAGMNVTKIVILAAVLSGGICGIAGMLQATGYEGTMTDTMSGGFGFTAIITAWLANLSAPIIIVVSFLFAALLRGSEAIESSMKMSPAIAEIIQGIILFCVLGSHFFTNYKVIISKRVKTSAEKGAEKND